MTNLVVKVFKFANLHPSKPAIIDEEGTIQTYKDLKNAIEIKKKVLVKNGIKKGDRVILLAEKGIEFPSDYLAVHAVGGISVPLDPNIPKQRLVKLKNICQPKFILSNNREIQEITKIEDENYKGYKHNTSLSFNDSEICDLLFTSGTTGEPKGVLLTHQNIISAAHNINLFIGTKNFDKELIALPLSHSFGLGRLRCVLSIGGSIILVNGFSRPQRIFNSIDRHNVTGLSMVPAAWKLLHKMSGNRLGTYKDQLRYIEIGSASLEQHHKRKLCELLPNTRICMHYGLTEASRATFVEFHEDFKELDSIGRPSPLCDISIMNEKGDEINVNEIGEICVKGPMIFKRYWKNNELTKASFFGKWFRTGDLGYVDEKGYLFLHGRKSEMINVGGQKVSPNEIEAAIKEISGVKDAACIGVPDEIAGEVVKAFIVTTTKKFSEKELSHSLSFKLENYKIPKFYNVVSSLPKTTSGKLKRNSLK